MTYWLNPKQPLLKELPRYHPVGQHIEHNIDQSALTPYRWPNKFQGNVTEDGLSREYMSLRMRFVRGWPRNFQKTVWNLVHEDNQNESTWLTIYIKHHTKKRAAASWYLIPVRCKSFAIPATYCSLYVNGTGHAQKTQVAHPCISCSYSFKSIRNSTWRVKYNLPIFPRSLHDEKEEQRQRCHCHIQTDRAQNLQEAAQIQQCNQRN